MIQERRISNSLVSPQPTSPMTPQNNVPVAPALPVNAAPAPSPISPPSVQSGHQRTVSAPPAPPPPPAGPPSAPTGGAAPPPPPPPPMNMSRSQSSDGGEVNSLAAQLQNARLKRNNKVIKRKQLPIFYCSCLFRILLLKLKIVGLRQVVVAAVIMEHWAGVLAAAWPL